ncbi:MAG: hypothetical protein B6226_00910, partial [Candidatus Cloacimonetes bacterium 4572_65]
DETYAAHTGEKYLAAFAAVPAGGVVNNDWVISQQFTLGATGTVSFWAMSITDSYGLERFNVLVSDGSTNPNDFEPISGANYVEAPTAWTEFTYDLSAYANENIRFAIQCVSSDAFIFMLDDIAVDAPGATPVNNDVTPLVSSLGGNYPNPFNPETTISYATSQAGRVTIDIYNLRGQKVKSLLNENKEAGNHTVVWNGTDENNNNVASGMFFYKMRAGKYSSTKKMILMK